MVDYCRAIDSIQNGHYYYLHTASYTVTLIKQNKKGTGTMERLALAPAMLLQRIGMHPRYKGYAYVYLILTIIEEHPEHLYNLRSLVYPRLTEHFNCTQAGIERNIRFAVQRTFERGDSAMLARLFRNAGEWPPTNTEFIAVLAQCLIYGHVGFSDGEELRYVVR